MSRTTIDYGIDLGTTNSSIAVINGVSTEVVKNNESNEITPSVVWIHRNNNLYTGQRAKNEIWRDDENACERFKLMMGTEFVKHFARSGRRMTPEELSAEVLKELKNSVRQRRGEDLQAAVITVPAAFELPQCEATKRAAEMAGITTCALLQEPIAAALARGFQNSDSKALWLVYDIGGGTFDAAVMQLRDGLIQVLNHEGDNALGGGLIDLKIVEEILAPAMETEFGLDDFRRGNIRWKAAIAKLKQIAEGTKILLSRNESEWIDDEFGSALGFDEPVQFEFELWRHQVHDLARNLIARSINICKKALSDKRLSIEAIDKVILVGGPTLAPYLREQLIDWIGDESKLDYSIDPLTVVSRGAAIFASTQRMDTAASVFIPAGKYALELDYKPVDSDDEPLIGGKAIAPNDQNLTGYSIEFVNVDSRPQWRSGRVALNAYGAFMTNLWAERGKANNFLIELWDSKGTKCDTAPDQITYTIGTTISEQLLTRSISLELADGSVYRIFDKGTPLPAKKTIHQLVTTILLQSGQAKLPQGQDSIKMPILEGENLSQSTRNRLIGTLEIKSS